MSRGGAVIASVNLLRRGTTLGNLSIFQFQKGSISAFAAIVCWFVFAGTAFAAPDLDSFQASIEKCTKDAFVSKQVETDNGVKNVQVENVSLKKSCIRQKIDKLESERESCKDAACRQKINRAIRQAQVDNDVVDIDADDLKESCDSIYDKESEEINECKKMDMKTANACAKSMPSDDSFMQGETMQMASPFLSSVNGADLLLGMYTATTDRPGCYLNKSDFQAKEDKLEEQKKDIEEKVKKNMEEAETAQTEYAEKLKAWSEAEGKIADRLADMPAEKEDALHKLDNEKIKAKMETDSKYNSVVDQIGELRRKYNDMVSAKAVALSENSDFAIHDRCAIVATGGDPTKQNAANPKPTQAVQSSFAGAFAQGKTVSINIQKRYDTCVKTEALKQKRVESTFVSELSAIKAKLVSMDTALGQLNEQKRLADQEIIYQMQNIEKNASNEAKKLAAEYQRIQTDKTNEQTLLKQKLERLSSDTKKQQQQLAILSMKLSAYSGKRPPKTINDKSMAEMMDQCGESFLMRIASYKNSCCKSGTYKGSGVSVCKMSFKDFEAELPTLSKDEKKAKSKERESAVKDAGKVQ